MNKSYLVTLLVLMFGFAACEDTREIAQITVSEDFVDSTVRGLKKESLIANSIKVMSFNIRHHDDTDPYSLDVRKEYVLQVVKDNNPDIVGMQELSNSTQRIWIYEQMEEEGYNVYEGAGEFGSPKAIFYRASRFSFQSGDYFTMEYNENRSGRWAILLDNVTGQKYFICNTHWSTNSSEERVLNAGDVVDAISECSQGLPIIIMGDLNSAPGSPEIIALKNGKDLVCAHNESGPTFHGWTSNGTNKIDWIFCSRNIGVTSFNVLNTSYDGIWPSDHWPIVATFVPCVFDNVNYDTAGISASSSTHYYFADVTGDGKCDKIYWNPTYDSGRPRVYASMGDGSFSFKAAHIASASVLTTTFYYFADVNGDNMADLIKWNSAEESGCTRIYLATGNGSFSETPVINTEGRSQSSNTTFYFADLTGDGKADKIYWNPTYDSGHTRVYVAISGGYFSGTAVSSSEGASESSSTTFYFSDVTGDGRADKIYWNPSYDSGHTRIYASNGDGSFSFLNSSSNGYSTSVSTHYYFADVDGDGCSDRIFWNPNSYLGKIKIFRSNGSNGTFESAIYSLRGTSQSVETNFYFCDITGDGKADQVRWNNNELPDGQSQGTLKNYIAK